MNLFDMLNQPFGSPESNALTALALGLMSNTGGRRNPMPGLLQGLQGMQGVLAQAEDKKRAIARQALLDDLTRAQIGETLAQAQQRQAQAVEAQRKAEADAERGRMQSNFLANPMTQMAGAGGPSIMTGSGQRSPDQNAAVASAAQRPTFDFVAAAKAFGVEGAIKLMQGMNDSRNFGADKVARVEDTMVAGRPVKQQFDDYGRPVGQVLPQWKAPVQADTGGAVQFVDPVTMGLMAVIRKTNSPDALLSASTARRGQDMADARSREANAATVAAAGKVDYKQDAAGNWYAFPKELSGTGPVTPTPVQLPSKRDQQATSALDVIKLAEPLIEKATGSYAGALTDQAARVFGVSTPGATADAQLKALEGALIMVQPRMEGPQSNKDTILYRQMAAQIGDSTIPVEQKRAAIGTIKRLHEQYSSRSGGASSSWDSGGILSADSIADELRRRAEGR